MEMNKDADYVRQWQMRLGPNQSWGATSTTPPEKWIVNPLTVEGCEVRTRLVGPWEPVVP